MSKLTFNLVLLLVFSTIASSQTITVTEPNQSTVWLHGQSGSIRWSGASGSQVMPILFQDGDSVDVIHPWTSNDGLCNFGGVDPLWGTGCNYRVKVIDKLGNYGWSTFFCIESSTPGEIITVTEPNETTVWTHGQSGSIRWNGASGSQVMPILFQDGDSVDVIHPWTNNDGLCNFDGVDPLWGTGTDFHVKLIDDLGNWGWSEFFTIRTDEPIESIIVTVPNSTTVWTHGEVDTEVHWSGSDGNAVQILLYKGGNFVDVYHPSTNNDGICYRNGEIPTEWGSGIDYRVKVEDDVGAYGWSSEFEIRALTALVSGVISDTQEGLYGVSVGLDSADGAPIAITSTNHTGYYQFSDVQNGNYTVSIVTPLGYVAESETQDITVTGSDVICDFELDPLDLVYDQRSVGFWKHQLKVYLFDKGKAQIPEEQFLEYLALIGIHFNSNPVHPMPLYEVEQPATQTDSMQVAYDILNAHGNIPMADKAKKQLMALVLNVTSNYLPQWAPISDDDATASQAITHCWDLIVDGDDSNDELAKNIADEINNGGFIDAGVIPIDTPMIYYNMPPVPAGYMLAQNYPNPVQEKTTIRYDLPVHSDVRLTIHNVQGQEVASLVNEWQMAGRKSIQWNAEGYPSGVYVYKLRAGDQIFAKQMVIVR